MKKNMLFLFALAALTTACRNDVELYNPDLGTELKDPSTSTYFDFSTSEDVTLNIDLGEWGKSAFFMLFQDNPVTASESGETNLNEISLYSAFAGTNGKISGTVTLPSGLSKVYLYCPSWALQEVTELEVKNGTISGTVSTSFSNAPKRGAATRSDNYTVDQLNNNFYMLCRTTNIYGAIDDINGLYDTGNTLTPEDLGKIQSFFWRGEATRPAGKLYNSKLINESVETNVTINSLYTNDKGEVVTVNAATVWLTLLSENASFVNTFGYYYYKSDDTTLDGNFTETEAVALKNSIKKFIIFPNVSVADGYPFKGTGTSNSSIKDVARENAPLTFNTRVKLLFQNEDGTYTDKFPAGYTIGFFTRVNGWGFDGTNWNKGLGNGAVKDYIGERDKDQGIIFSNKSLNVGYSPMQRFVGLNMTLANGKNAIVYGLEDSNAVDESYEDMLYIVESDPDLAIKSDDRTTIQVDELTGTEKTRYYYAFEDIWPGGGDYDLNDVIIRHDRKVTFTAQNLVTKIEDTFTPVQPNGSAMNTNGFAVNIPAGQKYNLTLPEGATYEDATNSVIVFTNTNSSRGESRTVVRNVNTRLVKNELKVDVVNDVNPFIIAQNDNNTATSRVEIHLPKATPTVYIDKSSYNGTENAFYIDADGLFPFAIALQVDNFEPSSEKVRIDKEYPEFNSWVESRGASYGTWYLNHVVSATETEK